MKRIGKINVTRSLLEDEPERVSEIFHFMKFAPFDIEPSYRMAYFTYTGFSSLFDEVMDGDIIPEYTITLHMNKSDGKGFIDGVNVKKLTEAGNIKIEEMFNESKG